MPTYHLKLSGPARDRTPIEAENLAQARNDAIRFLGRYLAENPSFANEGHWQLSLEDGVGRTLIHVIVATVVPRNAPRQE